MRATAADAPVPDGTADLRLGASAGTLLIVLTGETDLSRTTRGRGRVETVRADGVLVAVARRDELLREAARRRVPRRGCLSEPSQAARAPPTSMSPSYSATT